MEKKKLPQKEKQPKIVKSKITKKVNRVPLEYFASQNGSLVPDEFIKYNMTKFELVPYHGILVYIEGATHPQLGLPAEEMVYAINIVKRIISHAIKYPFILITPKKTLIRFNDIFDRIMNPYKVNHLYMCPTARGVWRFISTFMQSLGFPQGLSNNVGYNIAHIFELDDGYRYRLQDIATEINLHDLSANPRKEMRRVLDIYLEREIPGVLKTKTYFVKYIPWLLLIPAVRRALRKSLVYISYMVYSEGDYYWTAFKLEYKFGGKTHEERIDHVEKPKMFKYVPQK